MKLYRIITTQGDRWFGTQAEAKSAAKQLGTAFLDYEVPTMPKEKFLQWINEYSQLDKTQPASADPLVAAEEAAVAAHRRTTMSNSNQLTSDAIVAFILDDATVAQTCAIFEAIGSRVKEQLNAAR